GARNSAAISGSEPTADPAARLDFPFAAPLLNRTTRMAVGVARTHELRSAGTKPMKCLKPILWSLAVVLLAAGSAHASEADLAIPNLWSKDAFFRIAGMEVNAGWLLLVGSVVITGTLGISLYLRWQIHKLPAHKSMLDVAEVIYQTCKTYLLQQGKFLLMLFALIAVAITY